ncbi:MULTISPECIES: ankyrin repeat domain-containing protein [unclassified Wolbachia]|uniref:ankyrin repeat domain-containing protein n=1 Tax=unclassified Wolbachia TaxID=2640676 RepID=UPI00157AE8D0|nr:MULTISPECIES: ankyrin repeat domain-containing protein [unclassified Wolbachia]MBH5362450.1 ankyrin repeat domain-containing protein [Wolbachia endosymbiont of Kradibia gibbosae]
MTLNNDSLLIGAAEAGYLSEVRELLKKGADIETKGIDGYTPLHLAVKYGRLEVAKFLIEKRANVDNKGNGGHTPLHYAVLNGHLEVAKLLIERGANINEKDNDDNTLLHLAAEKGRLNVVDKLIDEEAMVNEENSYGYTPLHLAVKNGHLEVVKKLIEKGAKVNEQNKEGSTPLHLAVENGHLAVAEKLIARYADIIIKTDDDYVPLDKARENKQSEMVKFLEKKAERGKSIDPIRRRRHKQHHREQLQEERTSYLESKDALRSIENDNSAIEDNKQATSGASKPSSLMGSIVKWIKNSTESPALLTSGERNNHTVTTVPEVNATLVNNTIMLAILAAGRYRQPIHENLLSPREQSMRLNNIDEDVIRAMQESEEIGDPDTKMDEVKISGNKTGMWKGGK